MSPRTRRRRILAYALGGLLAAAVGALLADAAVYVLTLAANAAR